MKAPYIIATAWSLKLTVFSATAAPAGWLTVGTRPGETGKLKHGDSETARAAE